MQQQTKPFNICSNNIITLTIWQHHTSSPFNIWSTNIHFFICFSIKLVVLAQHRAATHTWAVCHPHSFPGAHFQCRFQAWFQPLFQHSSKQQQQQVVFFSSKVKTKQQQAISIFPYISSLSKMPFLSSEYSPKQELKSRITPLLFCFTFYCSKDTYFPGKGDLTERTTETRSHKRPNLFYGFHADSTTLRPQTLFLRGFYYLRTSTFRGYNRCFYRGIFKGLHGRFTGFFLQGGGDIFYGALNQTWPLGGFVPGERGGAHSAGLGIPPLLFSFVCYMRACQGTHAARFQGKQGDGPKGSFTRRRH